MRLRIDPPRSDRDISAFLTAAEHECKHYGVRLTSIRHDVLRLVVAHDRPVGAYEILEKLRVTRRKAAPPTVYRALDFLMARGFIHRLERLAAFVACTHKLRPHTLDAPRHRVLFLICIKCHDVKEICGGAIESAITEVVAREDFTCHHSVVEIEGVCRQCKTVPRATSSS